MRVRAGTANWREIPCHSLAIKAGREVCQCCLPRTTHNLCEKTFQDHLSTHSAVRQFWKHNWGLNYLNCCIFPRNTIQLQKVWAIVLITEIPQRNTPNVMIQVLLKGRWMRRPHFHFGHQGLRKATACFWLKREYDNTKPATSLTHIFSLLHGILNHSTFVLSSHFSLKRKKKTYSESLVYLVLVCTSDKS